MGKKQQKIDGFDKIMKPMNYNPKYLLDRKGNPTGTKYQNLIKSYIVEDKEDGLRGFIFVCPVAGRGGLGNKVTVESYTSGGVAIPNAKFISQAIKKAWIEISDGETNLRRGFVLDGEFTCKNWNDSNSAVKTQTFTEELAQGLQFKTWDIIPWADWSIRECGLSQDRRKLLLWKVYKVIKKQTDKIIYQPYERYNSLSLKDSHVQAHLQAAVKRGAEGIVIKEMHGLYLFKKCRVWMKLKPYLEADMTIIGAEEECDKNGKPKNSLGALVVKGVIDGKKIKTNVGGGYKRKERIDLWKLHKKGKLIGRVLS